MTVLLWRAARAAVVSARVLCLLVGLQLLWWLWLLQVHDWVLLAVVHSEKEKVMLSTTYGSS